MIFLYWFLGTLAGYACRYIFLLIRYRKGFLPHIKNRDFLIKDSVNAGLSYGIGLLFLFIIWLAAGRYDHYSTFLFFLSICLIVMFIDPWNIIKNWKTKKPKTKKWISIAFCASALLAETFIFNLDAFSDAREPVASYSLTNEKIQTDAEIFEDGHIEIGGEEVEIYIPDVDGSIYNLELCFADASSNTLNVDVLYRDAGSSDSYMHYNSYSLNTTDELFNILRLPVREGNKDLLLRLNVDSGRYVTGNDLVKLTSINFSNPIPFSYSAIRMMGILFIAHFFLYLPEIAGKYKEMEKEVKKAPYILFGGAAIVGIIAVCVISCFKVDAFYVSYPLSNEQLSSDQTDIYVALFDAFRKGQFHLDIQPSDSLLALEDPYVPANRVGVDYLWDHVFYNGKYYCYYGILPVLFVSFPLYLFSGGRYVPNAFMLEMVGMAVLIPSFLLLLLEIYRLVSGKVNWRTYIILCLFALPCALMIMSMTFTNYSSDNHTHEAIYHTPIIFALANLDLFLSFALIAKRRKKQRMLTLGLSGLAFVFIMMTRPSLFLGIFIALPFFVSILREKDDPFKKRILSFVPMMGILLVGAIFVCSYNYARFGNILEFGQTYQLTTTDARQLSYSFSKFPFAIAMYYFDVPAVSTQFPFFTCSVIPLFYGVAAYDAGGFGLFFVPVFILGCVCLPFLFIGREDKGTIKALSTILPLTVLAEAYTTYCKGGGVCARYLIEIYHIATISAVLLILRMLEAYKQESEENPKAFRNILGVCFTIFGLSAFITLSLNFDNFDGMTSGDLNGFLLMWKEVFRSLNC